MSAGVRKFGPWDEQAAALRRQREQPPHWSEYDGAGGGCTTALALVLALGTLALAGYLFVPTVQAMEVGVIAEGARNAGALRHLLWEQSGLSAALKPLLDSLAALLG